MTQVLLPETRAVIFDLDGTLYSQPKLRRYMGLRLLRFLAFHPHAIHDIRILRTFRKLREKHAGEVVPGLAERQYAWVADVLSVPATDVQRVVEHWMHTTPLDYLTRCRPSKLTEVFLLLKKRGARIGIFSDYPVDAKLAQLGVSVDATVHAAETHINALKPNPRSLEFLVAQLGVPKEQCLVVGNRESRDGDAARAAGIRYVHITNPEQFFSSLASEIH